MKIKAKIDRMVKSGNVKAIASVLNRTSKNGQ